MESNIDIANVQTIDGGYVLGPGRNPRGGGLNYPDFGTPISDFTKVARDVGESLGHPLMIGYCSDSSLAELIAFQIDGSISVGLLAIASNYLTSLHLQTVHSFRRTTILPLHMSFTIISFWMALVPRLSSSYGAPVKLPVTEG